MIDINKHPLWQGSQTFGKINPLKRRGHLARIKMARFYTRFIPQEKMIGVVGSVGKTSTTAACKAVLSEKFKTLSTLPNLDPVLNIPITLLKARPGTQKILLEMGIEYPGEMEFYLSIFRPKTVVISRLSPEHSEFLGGIENVVAENGKAVESLPSSGTVILNWDDSNCRKLQDKTKGEVIFYGTDQKHCHVWAGNIVMQNYRVTFELNYGVERVEVSTNFVGKHQIYSLLAAAALGLHFGMNLTRIKKALEKVEAPEHRLQAMPGYNGSLILDDSYNSSPSAAEDSLDTLNEIPARRRIAVLGEMKELGSFSEKFHKDLAHKIFKDKPDLVILGKGDTKFTADELLRLGFSPERLEADLSNPQIVSSLLKILGKGDVVLIKGSRGVRLDEVVKKVTSNK
jgi:UDP-N-acetylmuramoyl-tripeptide--D-alanyl-D-alanine ligase